MAIKVEIKGEDIKDLVLEQIEKGMNDLVLDMKNDATTFAYDGGSELSNRTGQLGNTMKATVKNEGGNIVGIVETHVEYAEYVEHGTGIYADSHRGGARTTYIGKIPALKGKNGASDTGVRIIKGQKPKHFMQKTVEKYEGQTGKYFKIKQ